MKKKQWFLIATIIAIITAASCKKNEDLPVMTETSSAVNAINSDGSINFQILKKRLSKVKSFSDLNFKNVQLFHSISKRYKEMISIPSLSVPDKYLQYCVDSSEHIFWLEKNLDISPEDFGKKLSKLKKNDTAMVRNLKQQITGKYLYTSISDKPFLSLSIKKNRLSKIVRYYPGKKPDEINADGAVSTGVESSLFAVEVPIGEQTLPDVVVVGYTSGTFMPFWDVLFDWVTGGGDDYTGGGSSGGGSSDSYSGEYVNQYGTIIYPFENSIGYSLSLHIVPYPTYDNCTILNKTYSPLGTVQISFQLDKNHHLLANSIEDVSLQGIVTGGTFTLSKLQDPFPIYGPYSTGVAQTATFQMQGTWSVPIIGSVFGTQIPVTIDIGLNFTDPITGPKATVLYNGIEF